MTRDGAEQRDSCGGSALVRVGSDRGDQDFDFSVGSPRGFEKQKLLRAGTEDQSLHRFGITGLPSGRTQSMEDWWAVQVRTGREHSAAVHLSSRGYETFLPCYLDHRQWSDRVRKVERALFAGYLFCRLTADMMGKVVSTPGVIRIVGNSRGPVPISQTEIDAVRRVVETRLTVSPWPFVRAGQKIRIEAGPLRNLEGVVLATKSGRRLIVSIPLLQQSVAVDVDVDWISVPLSELVDGVTKCATPDRSPA